jgi:hypothetical protein
MISRTHLILSGICVLVGGAFGAVIGAVGQLIPTEDVVSARSTPPRVERLIDTASPLTGITMMRGLGYGKPPAAPPPPPPPPRVVYRPPPPPPPPDIADVFRRSVVAIESEKDGVRVMVRTNLDSSPRRLRVGDTFVDGWVIAALSSSEGALVKGKDRRTIRLFAPPPRDAGVL